MHNIGRTVHESHEFENEFENEFEDEFEQAYEGEFEQAYEDEFEQAYEDEFEQAYEAPQRGGSILGGLFGESGEPGFEFEQAYEYETPFNETTEMELASELLEVQNEQELQQFLGKLFKKAAGAAGKLLGSPAGGALKGVLGKVAGMALPVAGKVLGGMVGGPVGAMAGGKLAGLAGKAFGLELEGLSAEDREFEIARAYVRFAGSAARLASRDRRFRSQPRQSVRRAIMAAARRFAPGLLTPIASVNNMYGYTPPPPADDVDPNVDPNVDDNNADNEYGGYISRHGSGRWVRRGASIILYGV